MVPLSPWHFQMCVIRLTSTFLLLAVVAISASPSTAADDDDINAGTTWEDLRKEGHSLVFGRLQGRFDGTEYRGRKIRVRNLETGDDYLIPVEKGLGFFEAALPPGTYSVVAIEAVYFPPIKPMKLDKFPPVRQRYALKPIFGAGLPTFPVSIEKPVYLGTIRSGVAREGLVYEGHAIEILDEYSEALAHLGSRHAPLAASFARGQIEPTRYFFVKPVPQEPLLEIAAENDPLGQARDYIADGKFEQALNWLLTFMPVSDDERSEVRLLVGEALLAEKKYDDAVEELGAVLLDEPENMRALRLLARAHSFKGHTEDALSLYQALAETLPNDAEASLHLGYHYALRSEKALAQEAFDAAFAANFDYLLHDLTPYALALQVGIEHYTPPEVIDGAVRIPSTMRSRRDSRGAFAILLDHNGRVVAAHLTPDAGSWAPARVMSLIRARFRPARLSGVPIPCLVIVGADNVLETVHE